jgi:rhamnopyranosyl-N-acetylglucosaminyl-diphospho-decaprenol beta-1,3/1,4-galactofuranosyltransferase
VALLAGKHPDVGDVIDRALAPDAPSSARERVIAVVVTHDRRELLRECLAALHVQQRRPNDVIVVDNASTDGTAEMVREEAPWARLVALERNLGGAGGFHAGLRAAYEAGAEWAWLLDDDTIPRPDALARLLACSAGPASLPPPSVLASRVVWRDGRAHPMNMPIVRRRDVPHLVGCAEAGVLPLRSATFVSFLVSRGAVERHGLPLAEYFLWADDIEYSARILREERGYLVPDSVVEHRTEHPHTSVTHGGRRFYYHARNTLFMLRGDAWEPAEKRPIAWTLVTSSAAFLRVNRVSVQSAITLARGLRDGIRRVPRSA